MVYFLPLSGNARRSSSCAPLTVPHRPGRRCCEPLFFIIIITTNHTLMAIHVQHDPQHHRDALQLHWCSSLLCAWPYGLM